MNRDIRPIFVIGTRFSGADLLALGLGQHTRLSLLLDNQLIRSQLAMLGGAYQSLDSGHRSSPAALAELPRSHFLATFAGSLDEVVRSAMRPRSGYGAETPGNGDRSNTTVHPGCERWICAGHDIVPLIQGLIEVFPKSKFIQVQRNPNEVIALQADKLASDGSLFNEEAANTDWAQTTALCLSAEESLGPDTFFPVNFDDLVRSPVETLQDSLKFVDELKRAV
jgi:hypothetical protein